MPVDSSYRRTRIANDARPDVNKALAKVATADQARVKEAIARVAGQDGNRYLDKAEAKLVADVFEAVAPGAARLSGESLGAALAQVDAQAAAMTAAGNVDGVSAHFSFGQSLEAKLVAELHDAVARASGRPLDVNMMIFEFQSDEIEQAIVEIARANPNVTFRIVADSTQATPTGGNALPSIVQERLPNVQVKYKKDFPYIWSSKSGKPVYNHGATQGLNHHKGFATLIDGAPDRVVTGSFNWSDTADEKNYEDLVVFKAVDAATRRPVEQFHDEFTGYFNSDAATLSPNNFYNFKRECWDRMITEHGGKPPHTTPLPDDSWPKYTPKSGSAVDVNGLRASDRAALQAIVGTSLAKTIVEQRMRYGRFASMDELKARVTAVTRLKPEKLAALQAALQYGSGRASINNATAEELATAGLPAALADAVVACRKANGDFESIDDLLKVPGMTAAALDSARANLADEDIEAFFNSRPFGAAAGGTGYGELSSKGTTVAMGEDGKVGTASSSVTVGATDLFNRAKPGQSISVAMYGMSPGSKEYKSLVAAAQRGVSVRVVLNDDYTESTVSALKALRARGVPVDVRVQKAKTMHEKFGVVGDDVFFGSANFSESSSTKHSEDRFAVKNSEELSAAFQARFDALWEKSKAVE